MLNNRILALALAMLMPAGPILAQDEGEHEDGPPVVELFAKAGGDKEKTPIHFKASGVVKDTNGSPIAGATVRLVMNPHDERGKSATETTTDSTGRYSIEGDGHQGLVRLIAKLDGFKRELKDYRRTRQSKDVTQDFKLRKKGGDKDKDKKRKKSA